MRLVQCLDAAGARVVAATGDDGVARVVNDAASTFALAQEAIADGVGLAAVVERHGLGDVVDLAAVEADGRLLSPIDHPDPAHLFVTGTGLTHLGSAEGRDKMHKDLADPAKQTDSMKMFRLGVEGGRPEPGVFGVQPEWFYKGDGSILTAPGAALALPSFALDGGEEPEIAGIYVIGPDGTPHRLGFALANEFSDHVTERQNYLYLAHSKLRACAVGPELLTGALPTDLRGASRVLRDGAVIWEKPFLSGESNMCHSIANLEAHHFKYPLFCRPGDVHVHCFGTATLSFSDGLSIAEGDVMEIEVADFGRPLRNPLGTADTPYRAVKPL